MYTLYEIQNQVKESNMTLLFCQIRGIRTDAFQLQHDKKPQRSSLLLTVHRQEIRCVLQTARRMKDRATASGHGHSELNSVQTSRSHCYCSTMSHWTLFCCLYIYAYNMLARGINELCRILMPDYKSANSYSQVTLHRWLHGKD